MTNQSELEQQIAKIVHRVKSDKFRPLAASVGTRYIMELITANYTPNSEVADKVNTAVATRELELDHQWSKELERKLKEVK